MSCFGDGECGNCGGSGYYYGGAGLAFSKRDCPKCIGGTCSSCGGMRYTLCRTCGGSGKCDYCNGSGDCQYCYGSGKSY